jgi:hypothetical protein
MGHLKFEILCEKRGGNKPPRSLLSLIKHVLRHGRLEFVAQRPFERIYRVV